MAIRWPFTTRLRCQLKLLLAFLCLITVTILLIVFEDKCETYDPLGYIWSSMPWVHNEVGRGSPLPIGSLVGDKILVIPALADHDMSWVAEELPDWQRAIYTVNPLKEETNPESLTTPMNKGHEAMAYLTYIIDNYNGSIPSIIAFLHSHRNGFFEAWHVDTPLHDNVVAMRLLNLEYVAKTGYVNLRCNWNPGCNKRASRPNTHITSEIWDEILGETSTPLFNGRAGAPGAMEDTSHFQKWKSSFQDHDKYMKMTIWSTCCAQFAVSREQILKRPLDDYVKMRQWIVDTELDDRHSGRVLEFLWHIIFGMEATSCPEEETCYCNVYGRC